MNMNFVKNVCPVVFLSLILTLTNIGVTPAYAASIVVNTNADSIANDGFCTLREAITNANNNSALYASFGECGVGFGTDTITFAGNYTITLAGAQLPAVTSSILINGKGAAKTIIQAHASPNTATYRVFEVSTGSGNLTLNSLTVRHGRCSGGCQTYSSGGGGIYKGINSNLTVTSSTISGNSAVYGGGIFNSNSGSMTVTNSTISENSADIHGGGIYTTLSNLTVTNSTISGNGATQDGAGIYIFNSAVTVTHTTFSGNSAWDGGGIYSSDFGTLIVTNSTFSGNSSEEGGGNLQ
jgi:CSLREA domain-containing protein